MGLMKPSTAYSSRVAGALKAVERDTFVRLEPSRSVAGRRIPPVDAVRDMLMALDYPPAPNVLHIGAGLGYLSAVLGKMGGHVLAIEKSQSLAAKARGHLAGNQSTNVTLRVADGLAGVRQEGPFDIVIVSTRQITEFDDIKAQLAPGGQLLCFEKTGSERLRLIRFVKDNARYIRSEHGNISLEPDPYAIYIELGMADAQLLDEAKQSAQRQQIPVIDEVRRLCPVHDAELYTELARRFEVPLGNVDDLLAQADPAVFNRFSRSFLDHHRLIPLCTRDNKLHLATSDPHATVHEIERVFPQCRIERIFITPTDLRRLWAAIDMADAESDASNSGNRVKNAKGDKPKHTAAPEKALDPKDLVTVFETILMDAVAQGASDIHFELYAQRIRIRMRIDGDLTEATHFNLALTDFPGLVNIAKLRARLDIAERRLPQGGRARLQVGDAHYDLRIQIQPSLHGECVTIRLLPQNSMLIGIEDLGLSRHVSDSYRRMLRNPSGMMIVVGPTGSGKSTTLYAGLQLLARDSLRKVITVEDPIEYTIDGVQQTQAHHDIGFAFADAIRAFLRLDPDVIMLGEIRDQETALEAVRASQTGHVLLSTLHSNDTIDAVQRLTDLKIHPNSLASELMAVMAQRLAKRICPNCKAPADPEPEIAEELFPEGVPADFRCFAGTGCPLCHGRGTEGRVAVTEFLQVTQTIRDAIASQTPVGELRRLAISHGLITMRESALDHVTSGRIPLSELPRILPADRMQEEHGLPPQHLDRYAPAPAAGFGPRAQPAALPADKTEHAPAPPRHRTPG